MRRLLRWCAIVVAALVAMAGVGYVWGSTLDREHVARVTEVHPAPPDEVFAVLIDHEAGPSWRPGLDSVEILPSAGGHPRWRETGEWGVMTYEEVESQPPSRYVARIADTSQGFGGTWTYDLEPHGDGQTRLTIVEDGWIDDPMFRLLAAHVFGHDGTMREVHAALHDHLSSR